MKHMILVSVSAAAFALGGCSMFDHPTAAAHGNSASSASQSAHSPPSQPSSKVTERTGSSLNGGKSELRAIMGSDELRQAQQKLKDDGDYAGQIDGKYGPLTTQAIKKFQKTSGLQQSGRLDQPTASKLGIGGSSDPGSSMPPPSSNIDQ